MLDKDGWTTAHAKLKKGNILMRKKINRIKPNKALAAHKADSRCPYMTSVQHIWIIDTINLVMF
jgi:hypothetical protein